MFHAWHAECMCGLYCVVSLIHYHGLICKLTKVIKPSACSRAWRDYLLFILVNSFVKYMSVLDFVHVPCVECYMQMWALLGCASLIL